MGRLGRRSCQFHRNEGEIRHVNSIYYGSGWKTFLAPVDNSTPNPSCHPRKHSRSRQLAHRLTPRSSPSTSHQLVYPLYYSPFHFPSYRPHHHVSLNPNPASSAPRSSPTPTPSDRSCSSSYYGEVNRSWRDILLAHPLGMSLMLLMLLTYAYPPFELRCGLGNYSYVYLFRWTSGCC